MKNRLMKIIEYLGITAAALERACGWSGGSVTTATDGISAKRIASLHAAYPEINLTWLITGEGEMIVKSAPEMKKRYNCTIGAYKARK